MGNTASNPISTTQIWMDRNSCGTEKWLRKADVDSVLHALNVSFFDRKIGRTLSSLVIFRDDGCMAHLDHVFNSYGSIEKGDEKRYWKEKDLNCFLQARFQHCEALINDSVSILWRCFHFHAYFPFSRHFKRGSVDKDAFYRAVAFLAANGDYRLQADANGSYIDPDRDRDINAFWRTFRSFSVAQISSNAPGEGLGAKYYPKWDEEDDLLDVLALIQPSHPALLTIGREELQDHSKRILAPLGKDIQKHSRIPRRDVISLLKLMLSIQLVNKPHVQDEFHLAQSLGQHKDTILEQLADAIVSPFAPEDGGDMDWPGFKTMLGTYLIHFRFQLQLIFTTFLSPAPLLPTQNSLRPSQLPTRLLSPPYAQYLSLLLHSRHPTKAHDRLRAQYTLQSPTILPFYSATSPSLSLPPFLAAVKPKKAQTLLLLSGSTYLDSLTENPTPVMIAIYMSSSWKIAPETKEYEIGPEHGIFLLEPRLQILRSRDGHDWTGDLVHVSPESGLENGKVMFGNAGGNGLVIDFEAGVAVMRGGYRGDEATKEGYLDIGLGAGKVQDGDKIWEVKMGIRGLEVYELGQAVWIGGQEVYEFGGDVSRPCFRGSKRERKF